MSLRLSRQLRSAAHVDCGAPSLTAVDRTMWHGCGTRAVDVRDRRCGSTPTCWLGRASC